MLLKLRTKKKKKKKTKKGKRKIKKIKKKKKKKKKKKNKKKKRLDFQDEARAGPITPATETSLRWVGPPIPITVDAGDCVCPCLPMGSG